MMNAVRILANLFERAVGGGIVECREDKRSALGPQIAKRLGRERHVVVRPHHHTHRAHAVAPVLVDTSLSIKRYKSSRRCGIGCGVTLLANSATQSLWPGA